MKNHKLWFARRALWSIFLLGVYVVFVPGFIALGHETTPVVGWASMVAIGALIIVALIEFWTT